jgi:hypothetical protein
MGPNRLIEDFFVLIGAPGFKELSLQPDRFSDCKIGSDLSQNSVDLVHGDTTGIRKGLIEHFQPFGAPFRRSGPSRRDRLSKMLRLFLAEARAVTM